MPGLFRTLAVSPKCIPAGLALPVVLGGWMLSLLMPQSAAAWGPHPSITDAALAVLPERERWDEALGADNIKALNRHCWLPDMRGQDLGAFYADDYLLIPAQPRHIGHVMPEVREAFEPYFRRALQALRTETPANACRQIGPILHFVEDAGAPPHAKEKCPHHSELENWVQASQIAIPDYRPRLLGATDEEALAGLLRRLDGLIEFSKERAERALPLVQQAEPDRSQVEPILLESALESARVSADLLYTLFTLGLAPQSRGAALVGTITAPAIPLRNDHAARVVLLGSGFTTMANTASPSASTGDWSGEYRLTNLPTGTYRVLAYRTGAKPVMSPPIPLQAGEETRLDITLASVEPAGNVIENPDATLAYLDPAVPDRWRTVTVAAGASRAPGTTWSSAAARVEPKRAYRCGAVLRDAEATVAFYFEPAPGKKETRPPTLRVPLPAGQLHPEELRVQADEARATVVVQVTTRKPLREAIERVWVVPVIE